MRTPPSTGNTPRIFLPLILFLALLLRLWNIDASSMWIDEIYSLIVGNVHISPPTLDLQVHPVQYFYQQYLTWQPMDFDKLLTLLKINVHMPLYYLLLNPWLKIFGTGAAGLRSFSAFWSVLMLLPIYFLGKSFGGRRAGLFCAFAGAVLPFQIYFAQEGRMYTLSLFWACLSALALWKMLALNETEAGSEPIEATNRKLAHSAWSWLYALAVMLGVLSHYMFAFYLGFHAVYVLIRVAQTRDWKKLTLFLPAALGLLAIALVWYPVFRIQQQGVNEEYHFAKGLVGWPRYLTALLWNPLITVSGDNEWQRIFYFPLTVLLLAFYGLNKRAGRNASPKLQAGNNSGMPGNWQIDLFLTCWLFVPLLLQIAYNLVNRSHTVVVDRYILLISPAMILWLGLALDRLFERGSLNLGRLRLSAKTARRASILLVEVMLLLAVAAVWMPSPFRDEHNKKDIRGQIEWMVANSGRDELVFINGPYGAPPLAAYYLRQLRPDQPILYWVSDYKGSRPPLPDAKVLAPYKKVWLFRNRANNERGLQRAKDYLKWLYPKLEYYEDPDWFVYSR